MSDLSEIKSAIDASNAALEQFKKSNDARLEKLEKGLGDDANLKSQMQKAFDDFAEQKRALVALETKLNRPSLGADGKEINADQVAHTKAFDGYVRKGAEYDKEIERKVTAISVGSGADGGYAVPKEIDSQIEALAVNISPIRSVASVVQVSTPDYHKLVDVRGTTSGWAGELTTRSQTSTPQLADIVPPMGELYAYPLVSQQSLDDVMFSIENWLSDSVATEFARAEGAGFVSGTGVVQPMGFTSYTTAATADATRTWGQLEHVATGTSAAFKTLTSTVNPADDLFTVVSKLKAAYRAGSVWLMNKATLFQIMAFKDYQGRYVFSPDTGPEPQAMMVGSLLGYPVIEAEDMATIAASSYSVAFGNFKRGYLIVDRIGTRVLRDPFSNKPNVGFYTTKRVGGAVINFEAIKLLKFI